MKEQVKKYILGNLKRMTFLFLLYIIGIAIGFCIFAFLGADVKQEVISGVKQTIELVQTEGYAGIHIIKNGMQINTILICILIISSFTIITFSIIAALMVLKGISLSMYICILFSLLGPLKGILAALGIAIIPNLITIFTYIFLGNECIELAEQLLTQITKNKVIRNILKILSITVMVLPFIILSLWIEQIFFRIIIGG